VVTTDGSIDTTGQRNLTITGELDAATLDISGAVDIAGASVLHGLLTQDGGVVFNEASADVDFRVEGNGDSNLMIIDGGADNVSFSRGSAATDQAIVHISRGGYNPGTSGKHALMVGANIGDANTLTNNNRKFGSIVVPHYTNAEQPLTIANIDSDNGASTMYLGGYSTTNSVENIVLRTASDDADKSTGANRLTINNAGLATFGASIVTGADSTVGNGDGEQIAFNNTADTVTITSGGNTVLHVNDAGTVTLPLQPAFLVKKSSAQSNVGTAATVVTWDTEVFDVNADFGSNVFTAPVTGKYQINLQIQGNEVDSAGSYVELMIRLSNRDLQEVFRNSLQLSGDGGVQFQINQLCDMDANDTATARIQFVGGHDTSDIGASYSFFSGFLAC